MDVWTFFVLFSFCIWRIAWLIGGTHKDTRYRYRVAFAEHRHKLHKLHFHVQNSDGSSPALPSRLISIIVKITAQCTSMADTREWLPLFGVASTQPPPSSLRPHPCPRAVLHPVRLSIQPSIGSIVVYAQEGPERKWNKKHTHSENVWGAAPMASRIQLACLLCPGLNSEACLNSEMNLWINTIMVIWHPLWTATDHRHRQPQPSQPPLHVCRPNSLLLPSKSS